MIPRFTSLPGLKSAKMKAMAITTINPATGEVLKTFEALTEAHLEAKLSLASATFPKFRKLTFPERAAMMVRAAEILESEKHELGRLMTLEMGKTLGSAVAEAEKEFLSNRSAELAASRSRSPCNRLLLGAIGRRLHGRVMAKLRCP